MWLVFCPRIGPNLLLHIILMLAVFAGAGLSTAARLKWDPTTYVVIRLVLPIEYRVMGAMLCFAGFLQLFLGHLATLAISLKSPGNRSVRRGILFMYAVIMTMLVIIELVTVIWFCVRITEHLNSNDVKFLRETAETWGPIAKGIAKGASKVLNFILGNNKVSSTIDSTLDIANEVERDNPRNVDLFIVCCVFVGILQPISIVLAINSAYTYTKTSQRYQSNTKIVHSMRYNVQTPPPMYS